MWRTDNNGQIAQDETQQNKTIGKWTISNKTEHGNGEELQKYVMKMI